MHGKVIAWALENAANLSVFEQGVMREYDIADRDLPFAERREAAAEVIGRHIIEMLALALDRHAEISLSASSLVRAAHLRRAESLIRQRLGDSTLDPQAVARGCGISLRYLHSIFADTGRTVSQCIREERLRAARDMLEMPGMMKMADVAYRFGFADQAIFSRQFRARYGVSPSEFRAANRSGPTDRPIAS